jgi:hypothetical protein
MFKVLGQQVFFESVWEVFPCTGRLKNKWEDFTIMRSLPISGKMFLFNRCFCLGAWVIGKYAGIRVYPDIGLPLPD